MATKKKSKKAAATQSAPDPREPLEATAAHCKQTVADVAEVVAKLTPPAEPHPGDLIGALCHITLAEGLPCGYGQEALRRIEDAFVDRNEFRVTEAFEVADLLQDLAIPDLFDRCARMREAIGQIYNDQNSVSLEFLREMAVSDRGHFFVRVPGFLPSMQQFVVSLMSMEECIFSPRSTQRVQQRLGLDPKASHVEKMFAELREILAPFGHLPLQVGPHGTDGKPLLKPELSPACAVVRLAVVKGRR